MNEPLGEREIALRQPVHALRRHEQGQPAELHRGARRASSPSRCTNASASGPGRRARRLRGADGGRARQRRAGDADARGLSRTRLPRSARRPGVAILRQLGTFFRTRTAVERWARARLFFGPDRVEATKQRTESERTPGDRSSSRLDRAEPDGRADRARAPAAERLRIYIDSPDGVDLALCERVTGQLRDLLIDYSLEVSSPGADRPLTKPEHFRRFLGRRVRVRTREAIAGRSSFTGHADRRGRRARQRRGSRRRRSRIPLERIRRSNLVPDSEVTHEPARSSMRSRCSSRRRASRPRS